MSTGYGWEGIRQVCATLLGARHVVEHLCGGLCLQTGTITSVPPLPLGLGLAQYCWHQSYFRFRNKDVSISIWKFNQYALLSPNLKLVQSSTFVITMNKMSVRYKSIQL